MSETENKWNYYQSLVKDAGFEGITDLLAMHKALQERLSLKDLEIVRLREAFSLCNFDASVFDKKDRFKNQEIVVKARKLLSNPPNTADLDAYVEAQINDFASEVKGLCQDFSSRNGSVYILDVKGAIDGLVELYAKKG